MTYDSTILADSPAAYLALQESTSQNVASGTTVADSSGNNRAAKASGPSWWSADTISQPPPLGVGRCWYSEGVSGNQTANIIQLTSPSYLSGVASSGLTYEMWVQVGQTAFGQRLAWMDCSNAPGWSLTVTDDGSGVRAAGPGWNSQITANVTWANQWHHVVGVFASSGTATVYVDGRQVTTGSVGALGSVTINSIMFGGDSLTGQTFIPGGWSRIAVYTKALTAAQVSAHYAAGTALVDPPTTPLAYDLSTLPAQSASALKNAVQVPAFWDTTSGSQTTIAAEQAAGVDGTIVYNQDDTAASMIAKGWKSWPSVMKADSSATLLYSRDTSQPSTGDASMAGFYLIDEPDMQSLTPAQVQTLLNQAMGYVPSGYASWANFGTNSMQMYSRANDRATLSLPHIISDDNYWYCQSSTDGIPKWSATYPWIDQKYLRRAASYRLSIEQLVARSGGTRPVFAFIETGHPYTANGTGFITAPRVTGAIWAAILGGAQGVGLFTHTFQDSSAYPAYSSSASYSYGSSVTYNGSNWTYTVEGTITGKSAPTAADGWVQWGATLATGGLSKSQNTAPGTPAAIKTAHDQLQSLASVIHSPSVKRTLDLTNNAVQCRHWTASNTLLVMQDHGHDSGTYTMTLPSGMTNVTSLNVLNENRTIAVSNGTFSDTFANEYDHHIYQPATTGSGTTTTTDPGTTTSPGAGTGTTTTGGTTTTTTTSGGTTTLTDVANDLNITKSTIGTLASNVKSALATRVPQSRKINNKALTADVTLAPSDIGALSKPATPSTDQMLVLKSDGSVVTQAIPTGGTGSSAPAPSTTTVANPY